MDCLPELGEIMSAQCMLVERQFRR